MPIAAVAFLGFVEYYAWAWAWRTYYGRPRASKLAVMNWEEAADFDCCY